MTQSKPTDFDPQIPDDWAIRNKRAQRTDELFTLPSEAFYEQPVENFFDSEVLQPAGAGPRTLASAWGVEPGSWGYRGAQIADVGYQFMAGVGRATNDTLLFPVNAVTWMQNTFSGAPARDYAHFDPYDLAPMSQAAETWNGVGYNALAAADLLFVSHGLSSASQIGRGTVRLAAVEGGEANVVYRALTAEDAIALQYRQPLVAKAPNGTWTASEHVANSGPGAGGAAANSPWISTSRELEVALAYEGGNGIVMIDLNKVDSLQTEVWQAAPRVNGEAGLAYHRSIWAQEVTVYGTIPYEAVVWQK